MWAAKDCPCNPVRNNIATSCSFFAVLLNWSAAILLEMDFMHDEAYNPARAFFTS
jgi:hypothetical protein